MKTIFTRILFFVLPIFVVLSACSKDDDSGIDRNCGTVLNIAQQSQLGDGGIDEWISGSSCGQAFQYLKQEAENGNIAGPGRGYKIYYKGETRAMVKYLLARSGSNLTIYVRYESNNIPQSSIDYWEDQGYDVEIKELTGLEGANY